MDKTTSWIEFKNDNNKEYEVEAICNSKVYNNKSEGYLLGLYYLISWKGYPEEQNKQESTLAI